MKQQTPEAARIDRLFLMAGIPVVIFMLVSFYVRIGTDDDPLWSEFATPMFMALIAIRALVIPTTPELRKLTRGVGAVLLVLTAIILILAILESQGAK